MPVVTLTLTDGQVRRIRDDAVTALRVFGELFERLREQQRERFGFPPGEVDFNFAYPLELLQVCQRSIESIDAGEADEATLTCLIGGLIRLGIMAVQFTDHSIKASHQRSGTAEGQRTAAAERNKSKMRAAWFTGKFATHSACAEKLAPDLHISVRQARKYLTGLKRPKRPK